MADFISLGDLVENRESFAPIKDEILAMKVNIKKHMDTGLTPDEMSISKVELDAVMAAERIIEHIHI